jgi:hypothetical protein
MAYLVVRSKVSVSKVRAKGLVVILLDKAAIRTRQQPLLVPLTDSKVKARGIPRKPVALPDISLLTDAGNAEQ